MKKNKILISLVAVAVIAVLAAVLFFGQRGAAEGGRVTAVVGANLALTSSFPLWSEQIRDGLSLAIDQHNKENPGFQIAFIVEDNQGRASSASAAFQKLVNVDRASVVVSTHTPLTQPLQSMAESLATPLLGTVVSAVGFGEVNEWSFLDWPAHDDLTPPVARYSVHELSSRVAATIVVNDDYGLDGARVFREVFEAEGGRVAVAETFTNQDTNMRIQLSRALARDVEVIYTVGREQQIIAVVRQAREMGFNGHIVGVNAFDAPDVWNSLGSTADGIIFAGVGAEDYSSAEYQHFYRIFQECFGSSPDWIALYGYTIGQYLTESLMKSKGNREELRQMLSNLDTQTLRGETRMTESRSIRMPVVLFRRSEGQNIAIQ